MGETDMVRLQGALDPRAREFRPGNHPPVSTAVFSPPVRHVYYPFVAPYPPPLTGVHVEPLGHGGFVYPQFPLNPGYFNPSIVLPQIQPTSSSPTRSLLLSSVPIDTSESVVRRDMEGFGDLRGVQMERIRDGIVTVHFFDLRHAEKALREIRNHYNMLSAQHSWFPANSLFPQPRLGRGLIAGSAVWAQFVIPARNAVAGGNNQGTVVVLNLESDVSTSTLREIFERFGPVKEVRETPLKKYQRFIEFFDVRDATVALEEINGKEIHGKSVVVEFSRPGGHSRKFFDHRLYNAGTQRTEPDPRRPEKFPGGSFYSDPQRPFYSRGQSSPTKLPRMCNRSLNYTERLVEELQSLSCDGSAGNGIERRDFVGSSRRVNAKKLFCKQPPPISKQESSQPRVGVGLRKNCFSKKCDPQFLISEDGEDEAQCRDSRTTVMIKNIPNKYNLKLLMSLLDNHCIHCNEQIADGKGLPLSSYDFVYLPIDFNTKCNVGYGFVNMTSPQGAWRLYKAFHLQHWEVFNSKKICEVTYARVQGLEALKEHFRKSKFPGEVEQYELPVVFSPPRDGVRLPEPLAVAGEMNERHSSTGGSTPVDVDEIDGGDGGISSDAEPSEGGRALLQ